MPFQIYFGYISPHINLQLANFEYQQTYNFAINDSVILFNLEYLAKTDNFQRYNHKVSMIDLLKNAKDAISNIF